MALIRLTMPKNHPDREIVTIYAGLDWDVHHVLHGRWYQIVKKFDAGGSGVLSRTVNR